MLGKLSKVDLRKVWPHEASDFTNWLAKDENLKLLSDEVGIEIKSPKTEVTVGSFKADIVAEEEGNTGRKIIIENQLEETNHDHLGKLLTYAAGIDAEIIIWIVKEVREEHKKAIDWLNEHTDEKTNFLAVKMELWQIGDSPCAPKFHIISQPNDWAKSLKSSIAEMILTDTKKSQLEFWNKFKEYAIKNRTKLKLRKTYPQHWFDISIGSSDAHISLSINTRENLIGCEVWISNNKELYQTLLSRKKEIELELKTQLNWMELPERKASRIRLTTEADIENTENWESYFTWLKSRAEDFYNVFSKYI